MFNKLAGNENVKQTLRHLLRNSRVPNSLLFAGDEGVGKKQFALELAKAFVCLEPNDFEACGVCAACRRADVVAFPTSDKADDYKKVFFSSHPDIGFVIGLKRNIYVDAIRELEREANFRPFESRARFFIVDERKHQQEEIHRVPYDLIAHPWHQPGKKRIVPIAVDEPEQTMVV